MSESVFFSFKSERIFWESRRIPIRVGILIGKSEIGFGNSGKSEIDWFWEIRDWFWESMKFSLIGCGKSEIARAILVSTESKKYRLDLGKQIEKYMRAGSIRIGWDDELI